ncbi:MAG TPA: hypothetical protein VGG62_06640 [Terracidiphilus sp.]
MSAVTSIANVRSQPALLKPILIGGTIAGILDITSAFITGGVNVPRGIAGGLLGPSARNSTGIGVWILGLAIHFFIAFSAATVYCQASRILPFLKENFVVCGMFFGIALFLVMYLVVMPLCAFHFRGPYSQRLLITGLIVHMLLIGLPIGWSLHRWGSRNGIPAIS